MHNILCIFLFCPNMKLELIQCLHCSCIECVQPGYFPDNFRDLALMHPHCQLAEPQHMGMLNKLGCHSQTFLTTSLMFWSMGVGGRGSEEHLSKDNQPVGAYAAFIPCCLCTCNFNGYTHQLIEVATSNWQQTDFVIDMHAYNTSLQPLDLFSY